MDKLILTYDIGTTGNKCTLFNFQGTAICAHTECYETFFPFAGWAEQNPNDFWKSIVYGTKHLLEKSNIDPKQIATIGLSGHMNGCIPVDSSGNVLYNDILHSDSRSIAECNSIRQCFSEKEYYDITGSRLDAHYTFPKILWLKKNCPEIYNKTAFFLASKDFVGYKLTGNLGYTDYSDASMAGMLDVKEKCWSSQLLSELQVDSNKLPVIRNSTDVLGYVSKEVSSLLGIPSGIPVIIGGGDAACATKGAGVSKFKQAYNYIGSSSWICMLNETPIIDKDARIFNFYDLDGHSCNICGTIQCATISYDWVLKNIAQFEVEECKRTGKNVFDFIDAKAQSVSPGSNGVFFLPYFMGERSPIWDENTKGCFIGMNLNNTHEDMLRSVYEGIAYALRSVLDVYEENNLFPHNLALIGGGAISCFWNEVMCDIFNLPIMVHKNPREATSLGAALAAGVGIGLYKDFDDAVSIISYERILQPRVEQVAIYKKYYSVYKEMYPSLKQVFAHISAIAK